MTPLVCGDDVQSRGKAEPDSTNEWIREADAREIEIGIRAQKRAHLILRCQECRDCVVERWRAPRPDRYAAPSSWSGLSRVVRETARTIRQRDPAARDDAADDDRCVLERQVAAWRRGRRCWPWPGGRDILRRSTSRHPHARRLVPPSGRQPTPVRHAPPRPARLPVSEGPPGGWRSSSIP